MKADTVVTKLEQNGYQLISWNVSIVLPGWASAPCGSTTMKEKTQMKQFANHNVTLLAMLTTVVSGYGAVANETAARVRKAPEISVSVNGEAEYRNSSEVFHTWAYTSGGGNPIIIKISNTGTGDLAINGWTTPAGFATQLPPSVVRPGQTVETKILPDTRSLPSRAGTLTFTTNDTDENRFTIRMQGIVFTPPQSAPGNAISTAPNGTVTIHQSSPAVVSIQPPNGPLPYNGFYVIRTILPNGRLVSRLVYDSGLRRVIVYRRPGVTVENWTNVTVELR